MDSGYICSNLRYFTNSSLDSIIFSSPWTDILYNGVEIACRTISQYSPFNFIQIDKILTWMWWMLSSNNVGEGMGWHVSWAWHLSHYIIFWIQAWLLTGWTELTQGNIHFEIHVWVARTLEWNPSDRGWRFCCRFALSLSVCLWNLVSVWSKYHMKLFFLLLCSSLNWVTSSWSELL